MIVTNSTFSNETVALNLTAIGFSDNTFDNDIFYRKKEVMNDLSVIRSDCQFAIL